jgi:hypothetical protein
MAAGRRRPTRSNADYDGGRRAHGTGYRNTRVARAGRGGRRRSGHGAAASGSSAGYGRAGALHPDLRGRGSPDGRVWWRPCLQRVAAGRAVRRALRRRTSSESWLPLAPAQARQPSPRNALLPSGSLVGRCICGPACANYLALYGAMWAIGLIVAPWQTDAADS